MYSFLQKNQGKISLKTAIFGLGLILIASTSGFSMIKFIKKASQEGDLTAGLPIVFAADQSAIFKIDLGQIDLEQSEIDITGPGESQEKFEIVMVLLDNGQYELKVKPKKPTIKPGRYQVSARFVTPQGIKDYSQDFYWGVLALNTNKSVYLPNEKAYIQMAVLTDEGNTICDADLALKIKNEEVKVIKNPACGPNNVIDTPDYYAYYQLAGPGVYQVELIAETVNGPRAIQDFIEVKESVPFEVERIGPTRIYPLANYQMKFNIKANQDFQGQVIEKVPEGFEIWGKISWSVDFKAGQTYQLSYTFDAPNISPEFYLLGPLSIGDWKEARHWQIAADAVNEYNYNGGSSVNWTDEANAYQDPHQDDTYASRDIPTGDDSANYILGSSNVAPSSDGTISKVEIGIEAYVEGTQVTAKIRPIFTGGDGDLHDIIGDTIEITDDDLTDYVEVTTDTNAPSPWEWSDIQAMDIKIYGANSHPSQNRFFYIDQIRVRVTHSAANYTPTVDSVTDSSPVSAGQAVTFSVDWSDSNGGGELVKAKICKTEGLTNQNCDGDHYASSTSFVSDDPVNETYTTTINDYGLHDYCAYVCDDGGLCSAFAFGTFGVGGVIRVKGDVRIKGGVRVKKY